MQPLRFRRRPVSLATRGAVACTALLAAGACSPGTVSLDSPDLSPEDEAACRAFVDDLPAELVELDPREVEPDDALGRAWGDPAIVVRCGVGMPDDFDNTAPCEEVNDVGWFVRPDEFEDTSADLATYTIGFEPAVELRVPGEYRREPATVADAFSQLSGPVKEHLRRVSRCA